MKMINHRENKADWILAQVPAGATYNMLNPDSYTVWLMCNGQPSSIDLPEGGRYVAEGLACNVSDVVAKQVVEFPDMESYFGTPLYTNYLKRRDWNETFLTAKDSLHSLLQSHGLSADTTLIIRVNEKG